MDLLSGLAFIWLLLLTLAMVALYGAVQVKWIDLRKRLDTLDLAERLQVIQHHLDNDTVKENKRLHRAIADAIAVFEANKHLMDRYWHEYQDLKRIHNGQ